MPIFLAIVDVVAANALTPTALENLPLARAVIGGLTASTLLTLFVVPVLYVLLKPRGTASAV